MLLIKDPVIKIDEKRGVLIEMDVIIKREKKHYSIHIAQNYEPPHNELLEVGAIKEMFQNTFDFANKVNEGWKIGKVEVMDIRTGYKKIAEIPIVL